MRFSTIFILSVAVCAATFANATPSQGGVEVEAGNMQFSRDDIAASNNNGHGFENVVRDINDEFGGITRRDEAYTNRQTATRRDVDDLASYTWAEFTDDYGNNGYGHLSLFSTANFYVPDNKSKIKIHSWPTNSASTFYIEKYLYKSKAMDLQTF